MGTGVVLIKCALDQIFFATQQDFIFLALCAAHHIEELPAVIDEVKDTFFNTWLIDCSLWPVVNFFGFAFVPFILQPSYMAVVSYFWQLYISSVAAAESVTEIEKLRALFDDIDIDRVSLR